MTKVEKLLSMTTRFGEGEQTSIVTSELRRLAWVAWHMETADIAITNGDIQVAKDCIKDAIAAVKEFNQ